MKESKFIDQNKEKWREFEALFDNRDKDPEKLSDLFIEVTNDLSYARSNYPHRSIKVYLNNLANKVFVKLYRNRLGGRRNVIKFWKESLPKVMYESRKALYLSLALFVISMFIGVFSSMHDPGFARHVLGDSYINMTERFIEEGDPMKVYKEMNQVDMFSYIALNNLIVSFKVFILGVFFAIGSVWQMIFEGIRIGAFQYFFIERGLFRESFLTVWMHGAPEISSIILAGAAGITLGGGLMFPGTYTRGEAFLKGARRGMMIMLGIVPILIFAALIEGFVTRFTELPDMIRAVIIFSNFAMIIYYFGVYPYRSFHNTNYKPYEDVIPETVNHSMELGVIRNIGEIYTEVYRLFGKYIALLLKWSTLFVVPYVLSIMYFPISRIHDIVAASFSTRGGFLFGSMIQLMGAVTQLFDYANHPMLYAINSLFFAFIGTIVLYHFHHSILPRSSVKFRIKSMGDFVIRNIHKVAIFSFAFNLVFFGSSWLVLLSIVLFLPVILLFIFISVYENCNPVMAMIQGIKIVGAGLGVMIGNSIMITLISFVMLMFFNSRIVMEAFYSILAMLGFSDEIYTYVVLGISTGLSFVSVGVLLGSLLYSAAIFYFSMQEKRTAYTLREEIKGIGSSKKAYGLPVE